MLARTRHRAIFLALSSAGGGSVDTTTTGATGQVDEMGSLSIPCAQDEFVDADGCTQESPHGGKV